MSRRAGTRTTIAVLAAASALLIPASQASAGTHIGAGGEGPVASKSGALINYVSTARLKVAKRMEIPVVCSAECFVTSAVVIKGPGNKITSTVSGQLTAGVPGGHFIKPNGALLKAMKAETKKFRFVNNMTATDLATGAQDHISHTFKLKR
jgi:hypothetical protein